MLVRPSALLVRDGRLLVMGYGTPPYRYNLPGGNPEAGEDLCQCLQREWMEELGFHMVPGELLVVAETLVHDRQTLHLVFSIADGDGEPQLHAEHTTATALAWLTADQLTTIPLYPAIGPWLANWLSDRYLGSRYLGCLDQPWIP